MCRHRHHRLLSSSSPFRVLCFLEAFDCNLFCIIGDFFACVCVVPLMRTITQHQSDCGLFDGKQHFRRLHFWYCFWARWARYTSESEWGSTSPWFGNISPFARCLVFDRSPFSLKDRLPYNLLRRTRSFSVIFISLLPEICECLTHRPHSALGECVGLCVWYGCQILHMFKRASIYRRQSIQFISC